MTYPSVSAPYGLLPVQLTGGQVYAGATRKRPIASGYAQNFGYGDLITYTTDGSLVRVDTTTGAKATFATPPLGIFLGCGYQNNTLGYELFAQSWPASTVAANATAVVADDPDIVMKAVLTNASGVLYTSGAATQAVVGQNIGYYQAGGTGGTALTNTATGNSVISLNLAGAATTLSLPFRVVDVEPATALSDGTFVEVYVQFNPAYFNNTGTLSTSGMAGGHFYRQAVGI